jgi:hypothetical protein
MPKRRPERTLYPVVEQWLKRHFARFRTAINKGLRHSRIDIIGVRDTGGDLSGEVETIAIRSKARIIPVRERLWSDAWLQRLCESRVFGRS